MLDTKSISFGGYFEDQPGPGFMGVASNGKSAGGAWDYVRKHKYLPLRPPLNLEIGD